MTSAAAPGTTALRLGHAGLIPFVLGALLVWLVRADVQPYAAGALSAYAAAVLSFLGGIHWGLAFRHIAQQPQAALNPSLLWGVMPTLLAWPGVLMPPHAGLVWLALALVACYLADRRFYPALGAAPWLTLRFRLTAVAALSCLLAAGAL